MEGGEYRDNKVFTCAWMTKFLRHIYIECCINSTIRTLFLGTLMKNICLFMINKS